jgi:hypothetical protein
MFVFLASATVLACSAPTAVGPGRLLCGGSDVRPLGVERVAPETLARALADAPLVCRKEAGGWRCFARGRDLACLVPDAAAGGCAR